MTFISRHIYWLLAIATVVFLLPIVGIANAEMTVPRAVFPETDGMGKKEKCEVCHNGRNPHTIVVQCNAVQRHLDNHPGDYPGPCETVTPEKPPKPPHPKP